MSLQTEQTTATVLPRRGMPQQPAKAEQLRITGPTRHDIYSIVGSAIAGGSLSVLFAAGLGLIPAGWGLVTSVVFFMAVYALITRISEPLAAVEDKLWSVILWLTGCTMVAILGYILIFVSTQGWRLLFRPSFYYKDMNGVSSLNPLSDGGIGHAIIATLEQTTISLIITVPLAVLAAIFLNEIGGPFARFVRTIVDAMTALPSVVAGLFIFVTVVLPMHRHSGLAAALAISVLMLPIMIRSADTVLRLVPGNLREAGYALGGNQWSVVRLIVLPTVRSGLMTAIILGTAHGIGETAPVMITAGWTTFYEWNPLDGNQTPLPLAALRFIKSGQNSYTLRGYATATVLLILVLILFFVARIIGGQGAGKLSPSQTAGRARKSISTLKRIDQTRQAVKSGVEKSSPRNHSKHPLSTREEN